MDIDDLNPKQREAIEVASKLGENLFITGSGGVGKSVLIETLKTIMGENAIVLAPTGIAA